MARIALAAAMSAGVNLAAPSGLSFRGNGSA
jgi:hypothetical protein